MSICSQCGRAGDEDGVIVSTIASDAVLLMFECPTCVRDIRRNAKVLGDVLAASVVGDAAWSDIVVG